MLLDALGKAAMMQRELLDTARWETKHQLSQAIFEWDRSVVQPAATPFSVGDLSPVAYEHHTDDGAESAA